MPGQFQGVSLEGPGIGKPGIGKTKVYLADVPAPLTIDPLDLKIDIHLFGTHRNSTESPGRGAPQGQPGAFAHRTAHSVSLMSDGENNRTFPVLGLHVGVANKTESMIQKTCGHASPPIRNDGIIFSSIWGCVSILFGSKVVHPTKAYFAS
jgi:hypothetical protein